MKLGCCMGLENIVPGGASYGNAHKIIEMGYDYIEPALFAIEKLSNEEFNILKDEVRKNGIKCEACNSFIPGEVRITGNDIDYAKIDEYLKKSTHRADELGVKIIVLGSSKARNVDEGFPYDKAYEQLIEAFIRVSDIIKGSELTIVVEPLQKKESNIINTVEEGLKLAKLVNRDNIKVLGDYYHMSFEGEDMAILGQCGDYLKHLHFANPDGRKYPVAAKPEYAAFFNEVKKMNYVHRLSMEAGTDDIVADAKLALAVVREYLA